MLEEDITFVTEEISLIVNNGTFLKSIMSSEELIDCLEVTPELLTVKEGYLKENLGLLKLIIKEDEVLKMLLLDRAMMKLI